MTFPSCMILKDLACLLISTKSFRSTFIALCTFAGRCCTKRKRAASSSILCRASASGRTAACATRVYCPERQYVRLRTFFPTTFRTASFRTFSSDSAIRNRGRGVCEAFGDVVGCRSRDSVPATAPFQLSHERTVLCWICISRPSIRLCQVCTVYRFGRVDIQAAAGFRANDINC